MINTEEFKQRLSKILEYYNLSASSFADKINIQRSSISHLLSGRNKPSLDFVLRVTNVFQEVNLYWLIKGEGSFPAKANTPEKDKPTLLQKNTKEKITQEPAIKTIEKIVIFYSDGSFKAYKE